MLGSYGLLGIFVYREHKAGLTPPTNTHIHTQIYFGSPCFSLWIVLKSVVTYIQTWRPGEVGGGGGWRGGGVVPSWRGTPLFRGLPLTLSQLQVTKQGWSLFPEASAASDLSTIVFSFFLWWFWWISMLLLYFICSLWDCPSFSCKRSPRFLYLFYPTNIFM